MLNLYPHLRDVKFTDAQRTAALQATTKMLVEIDVKSVDELRKQLALPPECLGTLIEIYARHLVHLVGTIPAVST